MSSSHKWAGRLFQTRGPATAKLLSPNVLCVHGAALHTICRWKSVAAVDDLRRPDVCRWRCTEVHGQTKTRRQNMLVCSQRVSVQEASATATKTARYGTAYSASFKPFSMKISQAVFTGIMQGAFLTLETRWTTCHYTVKVFLQNDAISDRINQFCGYVIKDVQHC